MGDNITIAKQKSSTTPQSRTIVKPNYITLKKDVKREKIPVVRRVRRKKHRNRELERKMIGKELREKHVESEGLLDLYAQPGTKTLISNVFHPLPIAVSFAQSILFNQG
ncbi:unnamed protein product [Lactuca virosa]|uniref:Uncharacterized protein n=1 Tax=Lactuca virosa TaxID=75947 RepID=A0AAU9MLY7_9ASTR|nr:unnamed protein product [Lactuca virosa]